MPFTVMHKTLWLITAYANDHGLLVAVLMDLAGPTTPRWTPNKSTDILHSGVSTSQIVGFKDFGCGMTSHVGVSNGAST